jgi:hypothetical protein
LRRFRAASARRALIPARKGLNVAGSWRTGAAAYAAGHAQFTGDLIVGAVLAAVIFLFAYRYSLWRRPFAICRKCDGSGRVTGMIFFWGRDFCGRCGGYGIVPRLGTRIGYVLQDIWAIRGTPDVPGPDNEEPEWPDSAQGPWLPGR